MRFRFPIVSAVVAVAAGAVVLYHYFFPAPGALDVRSLLLQWAIALAAVALIVGVINLALVHLRKLGDEQAGSPVYSLVLLVALIGSFLASFLLGPNHQVTAWIFNHLQVPIESSLMAVLAVSLVFAAARLLGRKVTLFSISFVVTVVLVFLGSGPLANGNLPLISWLLATTHDWITEVFATAGARGILIGVALGTIATGLRILMGTERPYSS